MSDTTPSPESSFSARELALLLTLGAVQFTNILDFMIMMPLAPQLMALFAIAPREFGLLVSAYTFAAAASAIVAAFWIDRFGRKRALLIVYAGLVGATALCGLAPSYELLLAARIVAGVFGGVLGALVLTIVADVVPYARRARGTAVVSAAFSLSAVLGVPLGLWISVHASWRAPFLVLCAVAAVTWLVAAKVVPPLDAHVASHEKRSAMGQLRAVFGVTNHLRAFAFMIALTASAFLVIPFIAAYSVANVGLTNEELAWLYLLGGVGTFATAPLIGWLADRYGKQRVFTLLAFASLVPLVLITHLPPWPLAGVIAACALFFVLVPGRFGPAIALVTGSVSPSLRGSFMSFNGAVQQLGAGGASLVAGFLVGRDATGALTGYGRAGRCAVAATLLAVAICARIRIVDDA